MSKFKVVFYKGPPVVVEGDSIFFNTETHMLEIRDAEHKVIAGFGQFQYWQKVGGSQ